MLFFSITCITLIFGAFLVFNPPPSRTAPTALVNTEPTVKLIGNRAMFPIPSDCPDKSKYYTVGVANISEAKSLSFFSEMSEKSDEDAVWVKNSHITAIIKPGIVTVFPPKVGKSKFIRISLDGLVTNPIAVEQSDDAWWPKAVASASP